jgi:predicted acylesterase/phospholipase RssA
MTNGVGAPPRTELRLAVAMSGGVSLCVWMGGVTLEIDRLRRGDGVYGTLAELAGVEPSVDIVAGTSAGGLNGVLLAAATAWDSTVESLHTTWLDVADFGSLLRPASEKGPPSLLQGEAFFIPQVTDALDRIAKSSTQQPGAAARSRVHALITTTLVTPAVHRYVDANHVAIGEETHLGLFKFTQLDDGSRLDFGDPLTGANDAIDRLARAARSSASFPFAFEPSFVRVDQSDTGSAPGPDLAWIADFDVSRYVLDGGLMDNEPVDQVLTLIADQPSSDPVRRAVLFVSPLAGKTGEAPSVRPENMPGLLDVAKTTLMAPREVRIASAIDQLEQRSGQAASLAVARRQLFGDDQTVTPGLLGRARDLSAAATELGDALAIVRQQNRRELASRPMAAAAPELSQARQNLLTTQDLLRRAVLLLNNPETLIAHRATISAAMARLNDTTGLLTLASMEPGSDPVSPATPAVALTNPQATDARASVEAAAKAATGAGMDQLADQLDVSASGTASPDVATGADPAELVALRQDVAAVTALAEVASGAGNRDADGWWQALCDLDALQSVVTDGRTHNPQDIDLCVLSTRTPSVIGADREPADKLTGLQLMHFGAFYQSSWRQNDWIWGRLDGSFRLVSYLADPEILLARHPATAIASSLAAALSDATLTQPLTAALTAFEAAGDPTDLDRARAAFTNLILHSMHAAILRAELPSLRAETVKNLDHRANDAAVYVACIDAIDQHLAAPADDDRLAEAWDRCRLATARLPSGELGSERFAEISTQSAAVAVNVVAGKEQPAPFNAIVGVLRQVLTFAHFLTTPAASTGPVTWVWGAATFAATLLALTAAAGGLGLMWLVPGAVAWAAVLFAALLRKNGSMAASAVALVVLAVACGIAYRYHHDLLLVMGGAFLAAVASVVAAFAVRSNGARARPTAER